MATFTSRLVRPVRWSPRGGLCALAVVVYTVIAGALGLGYVASAAVAGLVLAAPVVLAASLVLRRGDVDRTLATATGMAVAVSAALVAARVLEAAPLIALGVPAVLISAVVTTRRPAGALVLAFALTGSYGTLTALTPIPAGPLVDLVLGGLWVGLAAGLVMHRRRQAITLWPGLAATGLYLVVTLVMALGAESAGIGLESFRASAWYMLAALLMAFAALTPWTLDRIARGFVLVALGVGAYALLRSIVGPAGAEVELATVTNANYNTVDGELRLFGSLPSGHELGAWNAAAVPFCVAMALARSGRWRIIALVAAALCSYAIVESSVRTSLLAVAAGILVVVALYGAARAFGGSRIAVTAVAGMVVLAGAGAFAVTQLEPDSGRSARYQNLLTPERDPSIQARYFKWENALADIEDKPLGNGLGTAGRIHFERARFVNAASNNVDSSYLKIAFEQGFFVMGAFIVALVLLLVGLARRAVLTLRPDAATYGIAAAGSLVAFAVLMLTALYVEGLTALTAWMIVGLGAASFTVRPADPVTAEPEAPVG